MVPMRAHSSSVATPAEPCSPARADPAGGLRGRASATFFGLLIVGLLAGCGSGGSGGGSSGGSSSNQVIATGVISPDGGQIIGNTNPETAALVTALLFERPFIETPVASSKVARVANPRPPADDARARSGVELARGRNFFQARTGQSDRKFSGADGGLCGSLQC